MVYYSQLADNDLTDIFIGLTRWVKHPLEYEHAAKYVDDIVDMCDQLDKTTYHAQSQYLAHVKYGKNVYKYTRNKNTTWYIIYDYNKNNNSVYIQHISSNHINK